MLAVAENTGEQYLRSENFVPRAYPQIIKYMGSKARIIDFVVQGIGEAYRGGVICDLFAGACSLSGAIGHRAPILNNDIQAYSSVLSHVYLHRLSDGAAHLTGRIIIDSAQAIASKRKMNLPMGLEYPKQPTLREFNIVEEKNRALINVDFNDRYHLFTKFYSGTWWSSEQCAWIDALREVADTFLFEGIINRGDHSILLACIMNAMAYCGQGTGHYAQYRDAKNESSLSDINLYRQKSIADHFLRKFDSIRAWNIKNVPAASSHKYAALDFEECLSLVSGGTVYADPPYAFVHYSRFYHAIETFVLYDYPKLQIKGGELVKGRYREERHQSPFSIRSAVPGAFKKLYEGIDEQRANLVLSYSNTGLFKISEMVDLAHQCLDREYEITVMNIDHRHMTMGRRADRDRDVEEALLVAVRKRKSQSF